jgi:hypothetical protein
MSSRWDFSLNGTKARIKRGPEGQPGYQRAYRTVQLDDPYVAPGRFSGLKARSDISTIRQRQWSEGYAWWDPLLEAEGQGTYRDASGVTLTRTPGSIRVNHAVLDTATDIIGVSASNSPIIECDTPYIRGAAWVYDRDIYQFDHSDTTQQIKYTIKDTDVCGTAEVMDMAEFQDLIYILESTGKVSVWSNDGSASNVIGKWDISADSSILPGASIVSGLGREYPIIWTGNKLITLDMDGTTATHTVEVNDGLGNDAIGTTLGLKPRLAIGTSEGVWYVKNVLSGNQVQAWVFRVERDPAGNILSTPVATLPPGNVVTSLGWHLGVPILVAAETRLEQLTAGQPHRTAVYSVFQGTLGLVGSFPAEDQVHTFLFANGPSAFFAGKGGIFEYDGARGGLQVVQRYVGEYASGVGVVTGAVVPVNLYANINGYLMADLKEPKLFLVSDYAYPYAGQTDRPTQTAYLESVWFDFDTPFDQKILSKVMTWKTPGIYNSWKIQAQADGDTAYTDIATHTSTTERYEETLLTTPMTGRRFRYKLLPQDTGALDTVATDPADETPAAIQMIGFEAQPGETQHLINLTVDGTEFVNVEGEVQDPRTVYDAWLVLAQGRQPVDFIDYYAGYELDSGSTTKVRVAQVAFLKDAPGEAEIQVQLVEVD